MQQDMNTKFDIMQENLNNLLVDMKKGIDNIMD